MQRCNMLPTFSCLDNPSWACSYNVFTNVSCSGVELNNMTCLCPAGWRNDFIYAHLPNCLIPDYFELVILIVLTIVYLPPLFLHIRLQPKLRTDAKRVSKWCVAVLTFLWCQAVAIFTQGGQYEAGILAFNLTNASSILLAGSLFTLFIRPLLYLSRYAMSPQRLLSDQFLSQAMRAHVIVSCTTIVTLCIAGIVLCRTPPASGKFNEIVALDFLSSCVYLSAMVVLLLMIGRALEKVIDEAMASPNLRPELRKRFLHSRRRLYFLKVLVFNGIAVVVLPYLAYFVVIQATGSFPFLGFCYFAVMAGCSPLMIMLYWLLNVDRSQKRSDAQTGGDGSTLLDIKLYAMPMPRVADGGNNPPPS